MLDISKILYGPNPNFSWPLYYRDSKNRIWTKPSKEDPKRRLITPKEIDEFRKKHPRSLWKDYGNVAMAPLVGLAFTSHFAFNDMPKAATVAGLETIIASYLAKKELENGDINSLIRKQREKMGHKDWRPKNV